LKQARLALINLDKPNVEQPILMAYVMEIFVGVPGNVVVGTGDERH